MSATFQRIGRLAKVLGSEPELRDVEPVQQKEKLPSARTTRFVPLAMQPEVVDKKRTVRAQKNYTNLVNYSIIDAMKPVL